MSRNAETLKRLRAEAAAKGRCYVCRCRPQKPGAKTCVECLARVAARKVKCVADGLCPCGKPRGKGLTYYCRRCAARNSKGNLRRADRLIAKGLCRHCGTAPANHGLKHCQRCIDKAAGYYATYAQRNREAGLCRCGGELDGGFKQCTGCRAYARAYYRAKRANTDREVVAVPVRVAARRAAPVQRGPAFVHRTITQPGPRVVPDGWTVEQDRAEELLALSELVALRKVG